MSRRFVVTGCGRSGTLSAAEIFSAAGIPCRHEAACQVTGFKGFGTFTGEASWFAAAYLDSLPDDVVVIHQVRHPAAVAKSWYRLGLFAPTPLTSLCRGDFSMPHLASMGRTPRSTFRRWRYIGAQRRLVQRASRVFSAETEAQRCIRYWFEWNRLVETSGRARPVYRLRIEDLGPAVWKEIGEFLETDLGEFPQLEPVNRKDKYPARPFPPTPVARDVASLAAEYRYDLPQEI
jgi:hypothetical protein